MKATVIIPYNKDRGYLQEAIDSVPSGTEIILSKGDGTSGYNRNRGLKKVKTEFVKFLDEDDYLTENCIEDSIQAMEGVDFIHGNVLNFYPDGRVVPYTPPIKFPTLWNLCRNNTIHSPTQMFRMSVFERAGLFEEYLLTSQDWEFNIRCLCVGLKLGYCDNFLTNYRVHSGQIPQREQRQRDIGWVNERYKHLHK